MMSEHFISRIELTRVFVPFREVVTQAMASGAGGLGMAIGSEEPWPGGDFVVCRMLTDDGAVGLGEVMLWLPETGASPDQVMSVIRDYLARYLLGEDPFDVERINHRMEANVTRNEVAKGLLDMACYDLMGRIEGRRVCDLLSDDAAAGLPLAALIPLIDARTTAFLCRWFYEMGMHTFRLKLGAGPEGDVEIVRAAREELGTDVRLRVDYNQAYSVDDAVLAIKAIDPFGIDVAEQPVGATDFVAMARVQHAVDTPIMAHEGCFSLSDIHTLAELGAIGVVGVNSERPGGITNALRAIDFAHERGMGVVIHNQTLGVASAAQLHVAAARHEWLGHAPELFGHVMLEHDLLAAPIDYDGGVATLPDGPGWGVELDEEALRHYAVGPPLVIEKADA
jgi:muconate cycloisomerase